MDDLGPRDFVCDDDPGISFLNDGICLSNDENSLAHRDQFSPEKNLNSKPTLVFCVL